MLKKYIKFYLKTLTTEPMNWLFAFLWFSMVICAILIEFTTVVTYEGTIKEFIYLSLAMFVATIINAIVSWRFEQENIETTPHKTVLEWFLFLLTGENRLSLYNS